MSHHPTYIRPDAATPVIRVAVSARHVHLSSRTIDVLFGPDHHLHVRNPIQQPDQYASQECVTLVGPKGRLDNVRVVGPARDQDQVELARTDAAHLGLDPPLRESGHLQDTPGITLIGPLGSLTIHGGVIRALRHLHSSTADAVVLGLKDGDDVDITLHDGERTVKFDHVRVRVSPFYRLELHLDTDEAEAAGLAPHGTVQLPADIALRPRPFWPQTR